MNTPQLFVSLINQNLASSVVTRQFMDSVREKTSIIGVRVRLCKEKVYGCSKILKMLSFIVRVKVILCEENGCGLHRVIK